jgi:NADPH-dependent 7-cyano-7-deazaguanine reductase QueF
VRRRAAGVGDDRLGEQMRVPGLHRRPLVGLCPITNQPGMYGATIEFEPERMCLESKSAPSG